MAKKNTGRPYESLVKDVFQELLDQTEVKNIKLEKNKIVQGISAEHEIDVYWKFESGGIEYETLIQAKDWTSRVPQGEMLKFKAILEDIPGQPRGIFVSKTGYQSGAVAVAKTAGIPLYELRSPTEKDWKGRVRVIEMNMQMYIPSTQFEIKIDEEWLKEEMKRLGIPTLSFHISGQEDAFFIYDEKKVVVKSLLDIKKELHSGKGMRTYEQEVDEFDFSAPVSYIKNPDDRIPFVKLSKIVAISSCGLIEQAIKIDANDVVGLVLNNIFKNEWTVFDKDLKLKK
jgi:hypothetical protein